MHGSPEELVPLASADAGSGRGLRLVQEYVDSWGGWSLGDELLGRGAGKLLWFEVGGRPAGAGGDVLSLRPGAG
ncbi:MULTISPECIES: hypothetical protein [unclassified Streptomyces]|uniref:hypothetical protein n=1 Tax=unclassified Streptomyces TaxID=2593676 RepID=UPI0024425347|nr:hypothetical protein [Streptomyces sp. DH41]MDG9721746.1 hypothetical protein [Streptomyces sp. DH41]